MTDSYSDDDSDEWGQEELVLPTPNAKKTDTDETANTSADNDDDEWLTPAPAPPPALEKPESSPKDDRPMIIVDLTKMTKDQIHSKFDRNAVNDPEAASALRKKIEQDYEQYAKDSELLGDGTVIPCGMSVWRGALSGLRDERQGHYFAPIFPPKK